MFKKWFSKKKNVEVVDRDEWLERDYILVPNDTTPEHLTEYQKLIVLRKPEGEKRCVVDFSLAFDDVDKLQYQSLLGDVNLHDENLKRMIPTYLNTKEFDSNLEDMDEEEIRRTSKALKETAAELRESEADLNDATNDEFKEDVPILKTDNIIGKVLYDKMSIFQYEQEKKKIVTTNKVDPEVDDIDDVDIFTDFDGEIRESWSDVVSYFETEDAIETRSTYSEDDITLSPFYVPKIQPLFRNFIDVNFAEKSPTESLKTISETSENWYEEELNKMALASDEELVNLQEQQDVGVEEMQPTDEFVDFRAVAEDPEIVSGEISDQPYEEVVEQPKVLSFFKNEVASPNRGSHYQAEHIQKHVQFYKSDREFQYEKVILDKKRGLFNIRKKLVASK